MSQAGRAEPRQLVWFDDEGGSSVEEVGGKNSSLAELIRTLRGRGIRVPDGFATTAAAYRAFVAANDIGTRLREAMDGLQASRLTLRQAGAEMRAAVMAGNFSTDMERQIRAGYRELARRSGTAEPAVAVRSSATAEDLPDASFAGQQETFLNVRGEEDLLAACRRCYASLFTDRAISYREITAHSGPDVALSIGVQLMARSDLGSSGVMFSLDTETGFPRAAVISANWGLGETVVQGTVNPDKYAVFKPLLQDAKYFPVVDKIKGSKLRKLVYASDSGSGTVLVDTSETERAAFVLDEGDIVQLGRWAVQIEEHYGRPMDMEWAKDGATGALFIVQARPETVQARRDLNVFVSYRLLEQGQLLASGAAIGDAIATGRACVIKDASDIDRFADGSVLVTTQTDPDWVPIMKRAAAIVTDRGGATSHAAIVSRELGITAVVGTSDATSAISEGQDITVSCADGDTGHVYAGILPSEVEEVNLGAVRETRTPVMVNIADPGTAFKWWRLPARGVGLARMEFVINDMVQVHPMALVFPDRVQGAEERARIAALTKGYEDPADYFVNTLARGLAKLAAVFHPFPAIVRLSDFKSNEYAHLVGGAVFEDTEANPMLGFRGASRYYDPRYRPGFDLECRAVKRLREHCGFNNVIVMVPLQDSGRS